MARVVLALLLVTAACGRNTPADTDDGTDRGFEPPVVINAESPVQYPPALYESGVEGTVVLRLFVDSTGAVVPESTRVAESSGQDAFDSAAVHGVPGMTFAPAHRDGQPVATTFLQPIQFRRPESAVSGSR